MRPRAQPTPFGAGHLCWFRDFFSMYRWATSTVEGGEGGDHAQSARARKGRGNREGKQHVVLLNTENAGRGDA
jgi:hypothetical protein